MNFLAPQWFWLFAPLGLYLFERYRSHTLVLNRKTALLLLGMFWIVLAMARPALEQEPREIRQQGHDVIIALDLSYSMQAKDIAPSRLGYAKKLLSDVIALDHNDRFGIIGFTTNAIVLSPLSNDGALLLHLFERLDETLVMTKSTALMPALKLARKMSHSPEPIVLLLSDGGDQEDYTQEVRFAKENALHVNIALLATAQGATLTLPNGDTLEDAQGQMVISRANTAVKTLASRTGAEVLSVPTARDIVALLKAIEHNDFESRKKVMAYYELFYLFVILALMSVMLAFTTLHRRLFKLFALFALWGGASADAAILDGYHLWCAQNAYADKRYEAAAHHFEAINDEHARYNAANSYYKAGKYDAALKLYLSVKSNDATFKASLFFNAANCYVRLKMYAKAREMFVKSWTLQTDMQTKENLLALLGVQEQEQMLSGRQNAKQRAEQSESQGSPKQKEGGGSNMNVSADASSGAGEGKKNASDPRLSFSNAKGRLSSRQYELINQRSIHEHNPW